MNVQHILNRGRQLAESLMTDQCRVTHMGKPVTDPETGKPKRRLARYEYDLGSCMFCQLCVNACPHDAIRFSTAFEHAVYTRSKLVKTLNKI